ncbi:hypothetical protein [Microbacterium luticocti]|uniref:hypothetical protein n=1 Tax=Microbacterium luticocti TaxID=451764 RepID=UPI0004249EF0|nr:hypothetical protein [Microbacterium luticocti]
MRATGSDDDIDIRSGGVVAVDTGSLRDAAARFAVLDDRLCAVAHDLLTQSRAVVAAVPAPAYAAAIPDLLTRASTDAAATADELAQIVHDLRELADTYDVVEARARAMMALWPGAGPGEVIGAVYGLRAVEQRHPDAVARADAAVTARDLSIGAQLSSPANAGGYLYLPLAFVVSPALGIVLLAAASRLPEAAQGAQALIRMLGAGTIAQGSRLVGAGEPVEVTQVGASSTAVPPDGLADALGRIPDDARVRVETYTMPDGSTRYAVYVAGTRDFSPVPGTDPFDLHSDTQLYLGQDASAYDAVVQALYDAGVPEGATVYLFGHSLGGMIVDRLAIQGGYDTRMLVTAGSPTEAEVGPETLSVQLRHTDDVVQSLAAGGSPGQVGASGSLVVERVGDPMPRPGDLTLAPHHLSVYVGTARLVDAATDPRTQRMQQVLGQLRGATAVTAVEYDATRVAPPANPKPASQPSPRPGPAPVAPTPPSGQPSPHPAPSPGSPR